MFVLLWGFRGIQSLLGAILMGLIGTLGLVVVWWGVAGPVEHLFGLRMAATLLIALLVCPYLLIHDEAVAFLALILGVEDLGESPVNDWKWNSLALILFITPRLELEFQPVGSTTRGPWHAVDDCLAIHLVRYSSNLPSRSSLNRGRLREIERGLKTASSDFPTEKPLQFRTPPSLDKATPVCY
jgi:hypothetical protein